MRFLKMSAAALILVLSAGPGAALEPSGSCAALATWAAQLEKLPADYASFTALPSSHRRAVYQRLSAAERSGLWQHQWREELLRPGWNAEQRALIAEAGQVLGSSASAARGEAMLALEKRVAETFPREDALRVFYQLGPRESLITASAIKICNCTVGGSTNSCEQGSCNQAICLQPIDSCGFSWELPCDGFCS